MPLVFLTPYKKTYSSEICSLSTFIGIVLLIASILLPLFAAFSTEDFWLRIKEYEEHPLIEYEDKYMIYITECPNDSNEWTTHFSSSNQNLVENFNEFCNYEIDSERRINNCEIKNIVCTKVPRDIDVDGNIDKLTLKFELPNYFYGHNLNLDIKMIIFLKYSLRKKVKLLMTPMVYIDLPLTISSSSGKYVHLNGDLELRQKSPIASTSVTSQIYYEQNPYRIKYKETSPFDLLYYYNKYKSNNYTLKYNYERYDENINSNTVIELEMNVPKLQKVLYIESVYEALKYAWMQYFYIFLPIYILLYILFKFIIQNNIFYSNTKSNLY